jgi:hypothetical protein
MGKHETGYARVDKDFYPTPSWVIDALAEHVTLKGKGIWEPACGDGRMSLAIKAAGAAYVYSTDIVNRSFSEFEGELDFLSEQAPKLIHYDGIITNPPFGSRGKLAEAFIRAGLRRTADYGFLALLLPADFDSAVTRASLFEGCEQFAGKITLRKRIKWFDQPVPCKPCGGSGRVADAVCAKCRGTGKKKVGPKENHAWYLWQRTWVGESQIKRIMYAPKVAAA